MGRKDFRKIQNAKRGELAALSGLSRNAIASLEQGRREPKLMTAIQLADAFGVNVDVFTTMTAIRKQK